MTITNTGSLPLTVSSVATTGTAAGDYAATTTCTRAPVAPKRTCTITVRFRPTSGGGRVADLIVMDNAPNAPHSVTLSGIAAFTNGSPNTWLATGSMGTARSGHTATLLPDGRVLVVGGSSATNGFPLTTAELYDPRTGTWTPTGSMATGRSGHTATLLPNGQVLVAGGYGGTNSSTLGSAELYNPQTGRWTFTGSMRIARTGHTATLLPNGKVLVVGGLVCCLESSLTGDASAEVYDPTTGIWSSAGRMSIARSGHTATLLPNGKVLVAGGGTAELYDPTTGTWSSTGRMTASRSGHTATLLPNGTVLVVGGCCDTSNGGGSSTTPLSSAEVYDPRTGNWTPTGSMSIGRTSHTATLLATGQVLVVGGNSSGTNGGQVASTELYDPAAGTWTGVGSLITARGSHTATLLTNGKVVVVGGVGGSAQGSLGILYSAELYSPGSSPLVSVSPYTLDAGYQPVGMHSLTQTVTITNTGSLSLTLSSVALSGANVGDFTARAGCIGVEIAPHGNCAIHVVFTPRDLGRRGALLSVTDTAPGSPHGVALTGIGVSRNGPNTWSPTGNMRTGRLDATATLLPDGRVLVAGGCCDNSPRDSGNALASAELYNPRTGKWTATGSMNVPRVYHTATRLPDGRVLVTGGAGNYNSGPVASAELYDLHTGRWTLTGSMSVPRSFHTATLLPNGRILVVGSEDTTAAKVAELYNPRTGTWAATGSPLTGLWEHTATLLPNSKVLVAGGCCTASAELYDPATGTWTATGSMTVARSNHTATLLPNGRVLVVGGSYDAGRTAEIYDPRTGRWTPTTSMHDARQNHTATLLPTGLVLVAGGHGGSPPSLFDAELYDPRTGAWLPGSLPAGMGHTATLLSNGQVLIAGCCCTVGSSLYHTLSSAVLYTPVPRTAHPKVSSATGNVMRAVARPSRQPALSLP